MKNNWKVAITIITILVLTMIAIGCGGDSGVSPGTSDGDKEPAKPAKAETIQHVTASGPTGSGWYPISVLFADIWMDEIEGLSVNVIEGGAVGNVRVVEEGANAESALTFGSNFADALYGRDTYEGEKMENIQAIGALYPTAWNFVTLEKNTTINSVEDAIEQKVHIVPGKPGDTAEQTCRRVLMELGYPTYEDYEKAGGKISLATYTDGANMLRDGICQMAVAGGSWNVIAFSETDASNPIKLLPLSEDTIRKIDERAYGYTIDHIPPGVYREQKEEVLALVTQGILIVHKDVSDDLAYKLTKAIWGNLDRIRQEQPERGKWFDPEVGYNGILDPDKNIHPGAIKYYQEIGVAK